MAAVVRLLIETVIETVVLPALAERFAGGVPGAVLTAATARVTEIVNEGRAGDYRTLKKLVLFAVDEILRELEGEQ